METELNYPLCQDNDAPLHPAPEEMESAPQTDDAGTATALEDAPEPAPVRPRLDKMPMWKVLLHNDDVNTMEHVVESIVMLTPLNLQDSVVKSVEAHNTGVSLLLVTHKERAELYQDQFQSRGLTVTIEPDEA